MEKQKTQRPSELLHEVEQELIKVREEVSKSATKSLKNLAKETAEKPGINQAAIEQEVQAMLAGFHKQLEAMLDGAQAAIEQGLAEFKQQLAKATPKAEPPRAVKEEAPKAAKTEAPKVAAKEETPKTTKAPVPKPVAKVQKTEARPVEKPAQVLTIQDQRKLEIARLKEETAQKLAAYRKEREARLKEQKKI
jgi:hypothetical protein